MSVLLASNCCLVLTDVNRGAQVHVCAHAIQEVPACMIVSFMLKLQW